MRPRFFLQDADAGRTLFCNGWSKTLDQPLITYVLSTGRSSTGFLHCKSYDAVDDAHTDTKIERGDSLLLLFSFGNWRWPCRLLGRRRGERSILGRRCSKSHKFTTPFRCKSLEMSHRLELPCQGNSFDSFTNSHSDRCIPRIQIWNDTVHYIFRTFVLDKLF